MVKSEEQQQTSLPEGQELHALIERRREAGLKAAEKMSKRHLSLERQLQIIDANIAARMKY
jgi:hypothetical protein